MINKNIVEKFSGVRNSAVASQPCPSGHITADKRLRCYAPSPKLPSATSFIRRTLYETVRKKTRFHARIFYRIV